MWSDNVSLVDMLAYEPYAELISKLVTQERLDPLTLGLLGNWGSGKSTMLNLIDNKLNSNNDKSIVTIKVNAWLYEGYDDAKTALMESILLSLESKEEEIIGSGIKSKIIGLKNRVDWIRVGGSLLKKGIPIATSVATGNPMPVILSAINGIKDFDISKPEDQEKVKGSMEYINSLIKSEEPADNLVKNVSLFRKEFEEMIQLSSIDRLVILVDDLDRCNPDRIMETLEAIKLFLSVKNTSFILAIDEDIITYSIKRKYPRLDSDQEIDIAKDYLEKIIQIPIKLPELSEIDIKNYMLLLICEMFLKPTDVRGVIEEFKQKEMFTKGTIISSQDIIDTIPTDTEFASGLSKDEFDQYITVFSKVGDIISYSTLKGNPRQTKRFLNSFFIRKQLADIQNIKMESSVLAKLMVLEYTDSELFKEIYKWQYNDAGYSQQLNEIENDLKNDVEGFDEKYAEWSKIEIKRWLLLDPNNLGEMDLRKYFYLSRDAVRDKDISMLNISVEERTMIDELCSDIDRSVLKQTIERIKVKSSDFLNNVLKGVIVRFKQSPGDHIEVIIDLIILLPTNRQQLIKALKETNTNCIDPVFIITIMELENKIEDFDEVIKSLIRTKKLKETYAELVDVGGKK